MATKKKIIKKSAKPAKKAVKPAAKKPLPKKVAKPLKKVAAKKPVKAKPVAKKVAKKPVAKVVKKAIKKKVAAKKPVAKAIAKKIIKKSTPVAKKKVVVKKAVIAKKPLPIKPTAKKGITKVAIKKSTQSLPIKTTPVAVHKKVIQNEMVTAVRKTPIVIPKTSVTTSVKYTPDFTKSVLDKQFKQPQSGLMIRYSDAELAEFKNLITKKLQAAREDLAYSQGLITRKDEMGGDEENRAMTMEDGSMSMEREQLSQMASRQMQFIDHLEKALMRIENKTYGVCRVTGKLIDKARLQAVPHATLSMEAKMSGAKND